MTSNFLLLISGKKNKQTEVLIIGPKAYTCNNLKHCLTLDCCSVNSLSSVRNLGELFDYILSFENHVSSICKTAVFHLKNISKLQPMLSMSNGETLIQEFMTSRLDLHFYAFSRYFYPKQLTGYTFVLSACVFPGNRTHNNCAANAML